MRLHADHAATPVTFEAMPVARIDMRMQSLRSHGHYEHFDDHGFRNLLPLRVEASHWSGAVSPIWLKVTCNLPTRAPRRHHRSDRRYPNSSLTHHHPRHCCACVFERCAGARGGSNRCPFRRNRMVPRGGVERVRFVVDRYLEIRLHGKPRSLTTVCGKGTRNSPLRRSLSLLAPRVRQREG